SRVETRVGQRRQELGRRPTVEESSKQFEMKESAVRGMMEGTPTEISLSAPIGGEDQEVKLEDLIRDDSITPVDEALIASSFHEEIGGLLEQLDVKERYIIDHRFGLNDQEPQTLAEIG